MSAITLVNDVPAAVAPLAEFHLYQGIVRVARLGIHAGGHASIPTMTVVDESNNSNISTAQQWTVYAIANGITTGTVSTSNPSATVTLLADNSGGTFSLVVS